MPTEKEFLANPTVCKGCKDYWIKHRQSIKPFVCIDCAKLQSKHDNENNLRNTKNAKQK